MPYVKVIGESAFSNTGLESVNLTGITSMGNYAFSGTSWLTKRQQENPLVIVNNILINGSACSGDVTIPNGVTSIGDFAFNYCFTLTSITIPDSVTSIGNYAFENCRKLTSITYKGVNYTNKNELMNVLTSNGVSVETNTFYGTKLQ